MTGAVDIVIPDLEFEGFTASAAQRVRDVLIRELEAALRDGTAAAGLSSGHAREGGTLQLAPQDMADPVRLGKALARFILARIAS